MLSGDWLALRAHTHTHTHTHKPLGHKGGWNVYISPNLSQTGTGLNLRPPPLLPTFWERPNQGNTKGGMCECRKRSRYQPHDTSSTSDPLSGWESHPPGPVSFPILACSTLHHQRCPIQQNPDKACLKTNSAMMQRLLSLAQVSMVL